MKLFDILPIAEYDKTLQQCLSAYSTVKGKRGFLTRERKALESRLADFTESLANAKARGEYLGWLHGERIHNGHLVSCRNEIALVKRYYESVALSVAA